MKQGHILKQDVIESLATKKCHICQAGTVKLAKQQINELLIKIPAWQLQNCSGVLQLERAYKFKNYKSAWEFVNKVSALAEKEGHHPAILLEWGRVKVTWWTHAIDGLHQNDFICAAKTDLIS